MSRTIEKVIDTNIPNVKLILSTRHNDGSLSHTIKRAVVEDGMISMRMVGDSKRWMTSTMPRYSAKKAEEYHNEFVQSVKNADSSNSWVRWAEEITLQFD